MFNKIKEFFSSKSKWFKILIIILFIAVVIAAKVIDENKSDNDKSSSASATRTNENISAKEQPGIHIGIGHIVMLVVFTTAYGIDRVIVYKNNLKDEQKYDNHKEK